MSGDNAGGHVGRLAKLYVNITGTYDVPVWLEVHKIGDVDIDDARATSDRDSRESGNTKTALGNFKFGIKFEYERKRAIADPVYDSLLKSYRTGCCLDMLALDDSITVVGASGLRGPFAPATKNRKEPVNDNVTESFEFYEGYDYHDDGAIIDTIPVEVTSSGLEEQAFE